jgi:hypothetical protein
MYVAYSHVLEATFLFELLLMSPCWSGGGHRVLTSAAGPNAWLLTRRQNVTLLYSGPTNFWKHSALQIPDSSCSFLLRSCDWIFGYLITKMACRKESLCRVTFIELQDAPHVAHQRRHSAVVGPFMQTMFPWEQERCAG